MKKASARGVGAALLLVTAASSGGCARAPSEPSCTTVSVEEIAARIPGTPLGPWEDVSKHSLALVVWPRGKADAAAGAMVEANARFFKDFGAGALVLSINGPAGSVPTVSMADDAVKRLVSLGGRKARRDLGRTGDRPIALVRSPDGNLQYIGPLDPEHQGYNLALALKESLGAAFTDLSPLERIGITNLEGEIVSLRTYLNALPTNLALLDIWGTWCRPCRELLPHLVRLHGVFGKRVGFIGLTCETGETLAERLQSLEAFQKSTIRIPYPLLLADPWEVRLGVREFLGFPTLLLLERSPAGWRIVWQHRGGEPGDEARIEQAIRGALERKAGA